jgi:hypothetical protein
VVVVMVMVETVAVEDSKNPTPADRGDLEATVQLHQE